MKTKKQMKKQFKAAIGMTTGNIIIRDQDGPMDNVVLTIHPNDLVELYEKSKKRKSKTSEDDTIRLLEIDVYEKKQIVERTLTLLAWDVKIDDQDAASHKLKNLNRQMKKLAEAKAKLEGRK